MLFYINNWNKKFFSIKNIQMGRQSRILHYFQNLRVILY